jgi:hypothetical protein
MPGNQPICPKNKQMLFCILFTLPLFAFIPQFFAARHVDRFPNTLPVQDTIIEDCRDEWKVMYKQVKAKRNALQKGERKNILDSVLQNLDTLESSLQDYGLHQVDSTTGFTNYDINNHIIFFNIVGPYNTVNFVHETTHGRQFQNGGIVFRQINLAGLDTLAGGVGDDINDEIEAYRAQFAYDPSSISVLPNDSLQARSLREITPRWVLGLKEGGRRIYQPNDSFGIARISVTIWSNRSDMMEAYPKDVYWEKQDSATYILGNDPKYLNFPVKFRLKSLRLIQP